VSVPEAMLPNATEEYLLFTSIVLIMVPVLFRMIVGAGLADDTLDIVRKVGIRCKLRWSTLEQQWEER
jgi:hypothetical protein